jgi:hypothetical protein
MNIQCKYVKLKWVVRYYLKWHRIECDHYSTHFTKVYKKSNKEEVDSGKLSLKITFHKTFHSLHPKTVIK